MESKFREVTKHGYQIKVGDKIQVKVFNATYNHYITKVTKTMARNSFVKFPSVYDFGFGYKPKQTWDSNRYTVYELLP